MTTRNLLPLIVCLATSVFGQYTAEPGGAPPSELAPAIAGLLKSPGTKILSNGKEYCEIWVVKTKPSGPNLNENDVTMENTPHGSLLGAIRYAVEGRDRRNQPVAPGVYTLRFSYYPIDGAHLGVEPSRDFLLLSFASEDKSPDPVSDFNTLVAASRKVTPGAHPTVLSFWKDAGGWKEGLNAMGDDQVLGTTIGDTKVSIIVAGVNDHDK